MEFKIRKATTMDANEVEQCFKKAYSIYSNRFNLEDLPPMNIDYKFEIENYPCWVVTHNNTIAGGIFIEVFDNYLKIANVAVDPSFQSKGIGSLLLNFIEEEAKKLKKQEIYLSTHKLITENISYYQKKGYEICEEKGNVVKFKKNL